MLQMNETIEKLQVRGFTNVKQWVKADYDIKGIYRGVVYTFDVWDTVTGDTITIDMSNILESDATYIVYDEWVIDMDKLKYKLATHNGRYPITNTTTTIPLNELLKGATKL